MEIKEVESILSNLDGGTFSIFSDKESNDAFYKCVDDIVTSDNDKYPNSLPERMLFPKVHISRKKSKLTNNNILRIFENKKSPNPIAQYSYHKDGILLKSDIEAIRNNECTVYMLCHTDMDGDASGSLVFNTLHFGDNIKILRFNYEYKALDELILKVNIDKAQHPEKRFMIFIVDLCLKMFYMTILLSTFNKVVWIDHHLGSLPVANEIESGEFLKSIKKNFVTSDFSYVLDTRLSATQLALMWLKPYIPQVKDTKIIDGYKLASLITIYDMKKDRQFPEAYEQALYINQYYWDNQTLYAFTSFWKDSFMHDYELSTIGLMLESGKILWDLNKKKLELLYKYDHVYQYKIAYPDGKTLTLRAIYGTGNSNRFISIPKNPDEMEITMLIRYTATPVILSISAYSSDDLVKEMGINEVFSTFGVGQGHAGAAGMRISRHDMLKLATQSIFKVTSNIKYFEPDDTYNNIKIEKGLEKFKGFKTIKRIHEFKREINNQNAALGDDKHIRFDPEINAFVRMSFLIFATMLSFKIDPIKK